MESNKNTQMQRNLVLLALGVSLGAGVMYASKRYNKKPTDDSNHGDKNEASKPKQSAHNKKLETMVYDKEDKFRGEKKR
jgi:uncharacterized protein HemX